jgi:hypothetical protein
METAFDTVTICPECKVYGTPDDMLTPCPTDGRLRVPVVDWMRHRGDPLLGRVVGGDYAIIGMVGAAAWVTCIARCTDPWAGRWR